MRTKILEAILTTALLALVTCTFAQTWTQTSAGNSFLWGISTSADGRVIIAVESTSHGVISTDFGATWAPLPNLVTNGGTFQGCLATSADGSTLFAAFTTNGISQIFASTNSGSDWFRTKAPGGNSVACSASGSTVAAAAFHGLIYVSTNHGDNWSTSSVPSTTWVSIASSADGSRLIAADQSLYLYFSTNSGTTWSSNSVFPGNWRCVASSSDGKRLAALSSSATFVSTNSGSNWISRNLGGQGMSMSADGSFLTVVGSGIFTSTNLGATWITNSANAINWQRVASSADGCRLFACGNGIWTFYTNSYPQLTIQQRSDGIALSWPVSSTNFVLQQILDLDSASWQTLSNSPSLNFTNLQQQLLLPSPETNSYFRLLAQ